MQVRVIRKPQYTALCHLQIKKWWLPVWLTVHTGGREECKQAANNLLLHGELSELIFEGERK